MPIVEQVWSFCHLAETVLNTGFVHLDQKLAPTVAVNRDAMPPAVAQSYDALFYGSTLLTLETGRLHEITEQFRVCFTALKLWNRKGYLILGPYLPALSEQRTIESILVQNGLPLVLEEEFAAYYETLPVIEADKIAAFFNCVCLACWQTTPEPRRLEGIDLVQQPPPCPVFEEDKLQAHAEMIEARYQGERMMLRCVEKGDHETACQYINMGLDLVRMPNRLRNEKNFSIIFNTLLRKTIESAQVHPLYIDRLSGHYAVRIEQLSTLDSVLDLRREMVIDYCNEVKKHSLASYSPNVRRAINYITFNLSQPITLQILAAQLSVNASYLSTQFNKEVGKSIPQYLSERRVKESCRLLQDPSLLIGQVAAAVGFEDVNYFSRIFKQQVGCTPTVYRSRKKDAVQPKT